MAGFGARFLKGFVTGAVIGLGGLAALSLALPMPGEAPARPEAPALRPAGAGGLVLPDPQAAKPPASHEAGPDAALVAVPAASEFSRAARDGAPQIPARLDNPGRADAPLEAPAIPAPPPEAAPAGALAQPGLRPDAPPVTPGALTPPEAVSPAPLPPAPDLPVPVAPPGEVVTPPLIAPVPEQALPQRRLPEGPPPQILLR